MIVIVAFVLLYCFFAIVFACWLLPLAFKAKKKDAADREDIRANIRAGERIVK